MKTEYHSLIENKTWDLVKRPPNGKILSNKWVFKLKKNQDGSLNKYKARLVARGCEQRRDVDFTEIFAPVARYETIRALLAASTEAEMHIHQMDVVTAYVQGDLTERIYMEQPELFAKKGEESKVCKLKKPLYGLKQAGRAWYNKLDNFLSTIGMYKTDTNPCVYINSTEENRVIIVIYVDDLLVTSSDIRELCKIKEKLMSQFQMKDLGPASNILGMNIERDGPTGSIKLSQRQYIRELLTKFNMMNAKPVPTPLDSNIKPSNEECPHTERGKEEMRNIPYRELIGGLVYLANASRPDLSFAVSVLSRYCTNPGLVHWKMAKRVLRYLKGTSDYCITYQKQNSALCTYVDADWAGDVNDRKSCSGNVFILANGPISWEAKKQKSVALSTMEAEYMSLSEASKETIYLRRLLKHMGFQNLVEGATTVFCDSQSAIQLSKNNVYHGRSKHIDIRYHFSKEASENGDIEIKYLESEHMLADILTKSLPKNRHENCVKMLNLGVKSHIDCA